MLDNILLHTDVYKMAHMTMYPDDLTKIYSYLIPRKGDKFSSTVFFGLQYYISEYLDQSRFPTLEDVDEFMHFKEQIVGPAHSEVIRDKLEALVKLGYWPLKIEAVPEGSIINTGNVLATFESTHPDFPWVVGFLESLFLKVWNTCTVATNSLRFRQIAQKWADKTCDNDLHVPFQVHDFGYRGCSSEETAMLSGMAHLVSFNGTDTVPAVWGAQEYYAADTTAGLSVPASEHSVMCSYGPENEDDAFDSIIKKYPSGVLSIVSDTYNLWRVLTEYATSRRDLIEARDGKVVFRPDGGFPPHIVAGDPTARTGTVERFGSVELLSHAFGYEINSKGYKTLNPKVGIIFGEGMTHERFDHTCELLANKGFASSNFVIGVGGLLLQSHTRDDLGFALKATYAERNGVPIDLIKNPVTSPSKKSHSGLLKLVKTDHGYETHTREANEDSGLGLVYEDGDMAWGSIQDFASIRNRVHEKEGVCLTM